MMMNVDIADLDEPRQSSAKKGDQLKNEASEKNIFIDRKRPSA